MMRSLQLKRYSRARVWLDEIPVQAEMRGPTKQLHSRAGGQLAASRSAVTVEWHIPLGPRSLYGLLGVEYTQLEGELRIETIDEEPQRKFEDSLTSRVSDNAFVGLASEFREAVVKGILLEANKDGSNMCGGLLIKGAVVCEVNSCEAIFETLGRVVVALLRKSGDLEDDELQSMLVYQQPFALTNNSPPATPRG